MARSYSSSSSCFQSFRGYDSNFYAEYAATIIFLAVYLGTLIALCVVRRRTGAGKRLIGIPYMLALFFMFIQQAISFLSTTLQACDIGTSVDAYYNWIIASYVFYGLDTMLFLYVVIWTLNTMLHKQLGHNPSTLRITLIVDLVIIGGLLFASVVLNICGLYISNRSFNYLAVIIVGLVLWVGYLVSIIASGVLAVLAVRSLKAKRVAGGPLMIWISVLYLSLFVYSLLSVIRLSVALSFVRFSVESYVAMYWISSICHALAFTTIIVIAKNAVWRPNEFATLGGPPEHEDDGYNYQQDPIYDGAGQRA